MKLSKHSTEWSSKRVLQKWAGANRDDVPEPVESPAGGSCDTASSVRRQIWQVTDLSCYTRRNAQESFAVLRCAIEEFGKLLCTDGIAVYVLLCALRDQRSQTCTIGLGQLALLLWIGRGRLLEALERLREVGLVDYEIDGSDLVELALLTPSGQFFSKVPGSWFHVNYGVLLRILQGRCGKATISSIAIYAVLASWEKAGKCYGKHETIGGRVGRGHNTVMETVARLAKYDLIASSRQSVLRNINCTYILREMPVRAVLRKKVLGLSWSEMARRAILSAERRPDGRGYPIRFNLISGS